MAVRYLRSITEVFLEPRPWQGCPLRTVPTTSCPQRCRIHWSRLPEDPLQKPLDPAAQYLPQFSLNRQPSITALYDASADDSLPLYLLHNQRLLSIVTSSQALHSQSLVVVFTRLLFGSRLHLKSISALSSAVTPFCALAKIPAHHSCAATVFTSFRSSRLSFSPATILHGSTDLHSTMNSLNFVSSRVSPTSTPGPSRSNSFSSMGMTLTSEEQHASQEPDEDEKKHLRDVKDDNRSHTDSHKSDDPAADENTPLLQGTNPKNPGLRQSSWHSLPRRIASAFINSLRWVLSTIAAPGVYLIACLYDSEGHFSPLQNLFGTRRKEARKSSAGEKAIDGSTPSEIINIGRGNAMAARPIFSSGSSSSGLSSESESEQDRKKGSTTATGGRNTRSSKAQQSAEEINPSRRSIRIKLHSEENLRQRKHRKGQSGSSVGSAGGGSKQKDISAHLKSPTSPAGALTKYPRTPAPPRPLIPRRQPSYINLEPNGHAPQKTLILDLDETLIHSMSKGGRMSSGHMVEVKLNTTYVGVGGQASIGPQHPILYYVHKRPHCDDFLRRVSLYIG